MDPIITKDTRRQLFIFALIFLILILLTVTVLHRSRFNERKQRLQAWLKIAPIPALSLSTKGYRFRFLRAIPGENRVDSSAPLHFLYRNRNSND